MENLEKLADLFKALSDPTRLRIIKLLSENKLPRCVNALTKQLDISQSAVSQHLKILKQAGIVNGERRGNFVHYTLNDVYFDSIRNRLNDAGYNDFLVVDNNGLFFIGIEFWDKQARLKELEDQLSNLQNKTSEIEGMISRLRNNE